MFALLDFYFENLSGPCQKKKANNIFFLVNTNLLTF